MRQSRWGGPDGRANGPARMGYPVRDSPVGIARKVQPGSESPEGIARMGPNIARRGVAERARRRGDCTWQGVSDSEWQTESNEADWPRDGDDLTAPPGACNYIDLFLPDDLKNGELTRCMLSAS